METGDQYGLPDLRRFVTRRTHFTATLPQPSEPYLAHRNMAPLPPYHEAFMLSNGMSSMPSGFGRFSLDHFVDASATTTAAIAASASASAGSGSRTCAALFGADMATGGWSLGNIDGGGCNSRWPRQETLTLLEIRSRLDSKFKEANQKGPLWDEVSRLMAEEHGYQRSGKKCREKFENLYKYYKKTKEGKAGRQDGKNYRFFRQLEAIYGETSNQSSASETNVAQRNLVSHALNNAVNQENQESLLQEQKRSESLSLSNASEFETSSSDNNNDDDELSAIAFMMKQSMEENEKMNGGNSRVKKGWKTKVKDFVDSQMKKLIDSQDVWMERMLKTIEDKEQERLSKEEQWRRQEAARFDKEHEFWAKERAWIEARDAALMEVLKKFTGKGLEASEHEISSLIQLGTSLERRFHETGYSKQSIGEEIESKMVSLGYEYETNPEYYKKRKEDFRSINNFQQLDAIDDAQENNTNYSVKQREELQQAAMDSSSSPSNSYDVNSFQIGAVNQGDQRLWDRYGLTWKLTKGKNQQI